MEQIKLGLMNKIDVSIYAQIEKYSWKQMRELRLGLKNNLDVSYYVNSRLTWKEMNEIRMSLLKESTL